MVGMGMWSVCATSCGAAEEPVESQSRAQRGCVSAILCTKCRGMGQGQLGSLLRTPSATGMGVTGSLWDPEIPLLVVCGYWLPLTVL